MSSEPMTLRKLVDMLGPEYLDAPLSIIVRDGHRNTAVGKVPTSLWELPRTPANVATGEPARLALDVRLVGARIVKAKG